MEDKLQQLYKAAPLYRELFDKQLEFALSPSRFIAAVCSRRAGKTTVCAVKAFQELLNRPGSIGIYLALTDRSVEDIFMPAVLPLVTKYNLKCKVNKDEIIFTNGSKLLICGANHPHKIETFRGIKLLFCIIDEAASFSEKILHYLIDEIIGPALSDLQGQLMLIGTPAAHCRGMFHEVTTGKEDVWEVKRWTAFQNPFIADNFRKDMELLCKRKKCDQSHPKVQREYFGQWIADDETLMIRRFYEGIPKNPYHQDTWRSTIGIDFGFNDETAFSVIGWERDNPIAYVLECYGKSGMSVSQVGTELQRLDSIYHPVTIVGDPAGASKIMMEEFGDKYGIFMESAQKTNKAHYVEILGDALNLGVLLLHPNTTKDLQTELRKVVWNEERTREVEGIKCDQFDATLYSYRAAFAYIEKIPVKYIRTDKDFEDEMLQQVIEQDRRLKEQQQDDGFYDEISAVLED